MAKWDLCFGFKISLLYSFARPHLSHRFLPALPLSPLRVIASSSCPSPPRVFPSSGFVELNPVKKVEEEDVPPKVLEDFYPVYIGEVFKSRYQAVSKLGFGMNSTVWLCRDLR